ncbi:MAG: 4-phosphoerythronate dehydrogenase [Muribaculaceae bacterium]|nr:4-phosphoerythronate dehydrogenase [Muribaculaceae bacterium]
MKIIIEANIPYINGILDRFCEVQYLAPGDINAAVVADADALIVRTRTKCNYELLEGSSCKFIGTATIGTDHIDKDYCSSRGIKVVSAPGCNAPAVAQYVLASIFRYMNAKGYCHPEALTLGVVGVGHVGSIVARWAKHLGFRVLVNDPPRQRSESGKFDSLNTLKQEADIITFHTPLSRTGADKTFHLCDEAFLKSLSHCQFLINSARGEIVDNDALVDFIDNRNISVAIDCWENEPNINSALLERAFIATPHIAGYSAQGKHRATEMMIEAVASHFGFDVASDVIDMGNTSLPSQARIIDSYNPLIDTAALKTQYNEFEDLRNHYNLRDEA